MTQDPVIQDQVMQNTQPFATKIPTPVEQQSNHINSVSQGGNNNVPTN
jgi:hypothetical protein